MSTEYDARILALSPSAFWKCGEPSGSLIDSSGNANTATATGAPGYGAPGPIVDSPISAITLPGNNANYFTAPNSASLDVADIFTVIVWFKKAANGSYMELAGRGANGWGLRSSNANLLQLQKNLASTIVESTKAITDLTGWHMAAATKTGAAVKLYLDGEDVTGAVTNATIVATGGETRIGSNPADAANGPWNGSLGRVAVWKGVVLTAAQISGLYQSGIESIPGAITTTVVWREPTPPHAAIYSSAVSACKASFRLRGMGSASFLLPRGDSNEAGIAALLARCVPMVTVERSDGYLPFVGFPTHPTFKSSDTHSAFQLADHTIRLNQAKTRILAEVRQASGQFLIDEIGEMDRRAEPPIFVDLRNVKSGLPASLALSGQSGDSLLRELEKQTGHDGFLSYRISPQRVLTQLNWGGPQGVDRRAEDAWIDGGPAPQLADLQYAYDYLRTPGSVTTVGGTGALTGRSSATAQTATRGASIGSAAETAGVARLGFGGSRVDYAQKITDTQILAQRSKAMLLEPQNAAVQWEGSLIESACDMSRVGVGDIRVIRSESAYMGQPVAGVARITHLELNADSGVHQFIAVEVA